MFIYGILYNIFYRIEIAFDPWQRSVTCFTERKLNARDKFILLFGECIVSSKQAKKQ